LGGINIGRTHMMARRTLLASLATAAATSAFAQSQTGRAPGGEAAATGADEQHIQRTMVVGSLSLAVSRIAVQKVRSAKLKEFANFEVAEQETVADVLKSLQNPGIVNGTVKPPTDAEIEQHLDQEGRDTVQKMRTSQAGPEFDRQYWDAQNKGHEELLRIQEDYLRSGRSNLDSINVAKLARGMIKEHLQLLADIRTDLRSGTTGAAPRP
jgi:putative membrane protein